MKRVLVPLQHDPLVQTSFFGSKPSITNKDRMKKIVPSISLIFRCFQLKSNAPILLVFKASILFLLIALLTINRAHAQFPWTGWHVNNGPGTTAIDYGDGMLRLTEADVVPAGTWQSASAWNTTTHDLTTDFAIEFDMFFGCRNDTNAAGEDQGGDGITFQFHNAGSTALGGGGGFIGMPNSNAVGVEFDTWQWAAGGDLEEDHITIIQDGNPTAPYLAGPVPVTSNRDLESCAQNANDFYTVKITWTAATQTLDVFENGALVPSISWTGDIATMIGSSDAYWGFTSSSGSASNEQWIAPTGTVIPWECNTGSCCAPFDVTTTGATVLCTGPTTLDAGAGYAQYQWSSGESTQSASISMPGTYYVNVLQDQAGVLCPSTDTIIVTSSGPVAEITGTDATICSGTTTEINVSISGGVQPYSLEYSIDGVTQPIVSGINASIYTITSGLTGGEYALVSVSDNSGCSGIVSGSLTITLDAGEITPNDVEFCPDGSADLSVVDGGGTYNWYDQATDGTLLESNSATYTTPNLSATTTYFVEDIAAGGGFVTVGTGITGPGQDPVPGKIRFTANVTGELTSLDLNHMGTAGNIVLVIEDLTDPANDSTYSFPITAASPSTVIPNYPLISGHQYDISYSGNSGITPQVWYVTNANYPNTTWPEITFDSYENPSPGVDPWFGDNWVLGVGPDCPRTPVSAIAHTIPSGDLTGTATICQGATTDLSISLTGTGPWDITYTDPSSTVVNETTSDNPFTFTVGTVGTYTLTALNDFNCTGIVSGTAEVSSLTDISISNVQAICNANQLDYTVTFDVSGGNGTYLFSGQSGTFAAGTFTSDPNVSGVAYSFDVDDSDNCNPQNVSGAAPTCGCPVTATMSGGGTICDDGSTIDVIITLAGSGNAPYEFTYTDPAGTPISVTGEAGPTFTIASNTAGTYTVTAVNDQGCVGEVSGSALVEIDALPPVATTGGDINICVVDPVALTGNDPSPGTGSWSVLAGSTSGITIDDQNQFNSNVSGFSANGDILNAEWCINNGVCPQTCETMTVTGTGVADPVVSLSSDAGGSVCTGTTVTFTATPTNGGSAPLYTFFDSEDNLLQAESANPTLVLNLNQDTSVYVVLVSNSSCAVDLDDTSAMVTISVDQIPVAEAGENFDVCTTTATLNADVPLVGTGVWTSTTAAVADVPNSPTSSVSNLPEGVSRFYWEVSNGTCPMSIDSVDINRAGSLTSSDVQGQSTTMCISGLAPALLGTPLNGAAVPAETGTWTSLDGASINQSGVDATITGGISVGENRFVYEISNGLCVPNSRDTVTVTVDENPSVADAGSPANTCASNYQLAAITPTIGTGIWTSETGLSIDDALLNNATAQNLISGNNKFYWTVSNGSCPESIDSVDINKFGTLTSADPGSYVDLCESTTSVTLAGAQPNTSNGESGSWSVVGPANVLDLTDPATLLTITGPGTVDLTWTITNGGICPDDAKSTSFIVDASPSTADAGPDTTICADTYDMRAVSPISGSGSWTTSSGASVASTTLPTSTVSDLSTGDNVFIWTVSSVEGVCDNSIAVVNVSSAEASDPIVTLSTPADMPICSSDIITYSAANVQGGGSNPTYEWFVNGASVQGPSVANTYSSTYTSGDIVEVVMTSTLSCVLSPTDNDNATVTVQTPPTPSIDGGDDTICVTGSMLLTANTDATSTFEWVHNGVPTGFSTSTILVDELSEAGSWTINEDDGVCPTVASSPKLVGVDLLPTVDAGGPYQLFDYEAIILEGEAVNATSNFWTPALNFDDPTSLNPEYTPTEGGTFNVSLVAVNGMCIDSAEAQITVYSPIKIPNAFTPNGDGQYDVWEIDGISTYTSAALQVFNRWGSLVYESFGTIKFWDGTRNGKPMPVAAYYYVLDLQNGEEPKSGDVTIIR